MVVRSLALVILLAAWPVSAQLPVSEHLSDSDLPLFRAEISRLENLLSSAPDKATVMFELARTWASAKQWPETIDWLRKVVERKAGLDPSRDSVFAQLRGSREFNAVLSTVIQATPPVSHSSQEFTVSEGDLVPESIAYSSRGKYFYLGSMNKGKVLRCSIVGICTQFADGLATVLGLKVHGDGLWLLNNSGQESALIHYDLASARMLRKYVVSGRGHNFNDLAISEAGDVYLTDTPAGAVWQLSRGASDLTRLPGRFDFANGVALSPDSRLLYVSTFPDGITVLNLKTRVASPIPRPADLCLATIDGLYFHNRSLIAIQNGFMTPRVARFHLAPDLKTIQRLEVLERRNPQFEGITTGVLVGDRLFYMANIQDDKKTAFNPIAILSLSL